MSQANTIAVNTIVQTGGKIVSVALGWATVLAMTNYLGASGFGDYTIMTAFLQFFGVAVDLGIVLVSAQLLAEAVGNRDELFANLFTFRLVTSAAVLLVAPLVVWFLPYSLVVKQGVVLLTASFLLVALLQVFTGLFQQSLSMWRSVVGEVSGRLVLLLAVVAAILLKQDLLFIVAGVVVSSVVNVGLAYVLSRRLVRLRFAYDPVLWRHIWQRAWPIAVGIMLNLVYLKADTLILSFVRPAAEVGVYGAMFRVLEVLITFPTMFAGLLLPVLAAAWRANDRPLFSRTIQQAVDTTLYVALPLVVGVTLTAPKLVALFGEEFVATGTPVLRLLALATGIIFIGTLLGHVVVAIGRQRAVLGAYAFTAVLSLVGYLAIIPYFGAVGAAVVTVAVELLITVLLFFYLRRTIALSFRLHELRPAIVATVVMAAWLWVGGMFSIWLLVPVAMLLYGGTLFVAGPLPRQVLTEAFALLTRRK